MRKTVEEILPNGVMSVMQTVDAVKVGSLFTAEEVESFDALFMSYHGERGASFALSRADELGKVNDLLSAVLNKYYESWTREKNALELEYDVLDTKGGKRTITETRNETGTDGESESVQNSMNAFDGATPSDTDKTARNKDGEHITDTTTKRTENYAGNGAGLTQAEVIRKEVGLRASHNFFDLVGEDISREIAAAVY